MPSSAPPSRAYANYVLGVLVVVYVFNFIDRRILAVALYFIAGQTLRRDLPAKGT